MHDAELMARSAAGDRRAFDAVVVRHGPFVLRVARRLVQQRDAAEEVAQDALLRAWSQATSFDPGRARFTTWLYRIVVNRCIDHRRRAREMPMPEHFDLPDPAATVDEAADIRDRRQALAVALDALPLRQRAAMALVYEEGMSGAEAARALGVSAKAVERMLARARTHLRERLDGNGGKTES